jgi:hypothetical protein
MLITGQLTSAHDEILAEWHESEPLPFFGALLDALDHVRALNAEDFFTDYGAVMFRAAIGEYWFDCGTIAIRDDPSQVAEHFEAVVVSMFADAQFWLWEREEDEHASREACRDTEESFRWNF